MPTPPRAAMSPGEIKQDFESAMTRHFSFKTKLRSFLYGNGYEEGPLRDPDQCSLGHWIAERRARAYAHVPEMRDLDAAHRRIHQAANVLMDHRLAGRAEAAAAGLPAVLAQAEGIVTLLQTIERKLRTEA
ncbi:CZB domain-containing protein [Hymenobacter caeli]|uniref:Chemoreceptor zinc-binding domain-containing protein n=1 Tax=Hymenobacter caeli TaxID=2735894 RepID=A0ABX2FPE3_9BACT|nr:CZB domain-containing protein [Hymenobacter caeli]NRT19050.1 hypothetical protein [Hymenobacter caeli]